MRNLAWILCALLIAAGCVSKPRPDGYDSMPDPMMVMGGVGLSGEDPMTDVRADRLLVWKAELTVSVENVSNAVCQAISAVEKQRGFVEKRSDHGGLSATLTLRVPSQSLKAAVTDLEGLGIVTHRQIEGEDVTEEYVDVGARLKNKIALRDRLKEVLAKAVEVKDILAVETELNRVQGDIESMEARIKALRGQVDYSQVTLRLARMEPMKPKRILGPLGYLFKGLWWGVSKLFVIRE